jgi:hypothetical protein
MNPKNRFKLNRQAMLLATISAAFPVVGYCSAGRVDFAIGNVEAVTANGTRHPLNRGAEINAGETISTAAGARAQVRFADGGFISLQPNTQFRVDEFNYKNKTNGDEKGFFSLLKGGFRAITGAIGHVNKNAYQIKTSAATLGIRGTGYNMALRDDGLFVNVGEGAISLSNNAGLLVVTAGGAAFVANLNTPPVPTNEQPQTPPAALPEPTFTVADKRDSAGNLAVIPVMQSGTGYVLSYAYTDGMATYGSSRITGVTTTFDSSSLLTSYNNGTQSATPGTATTYSVSDGIIGWGRWAGVTTGSGLPDPNPLFSYGVYDYITGIPTAVMPQTGSATYSLMGYTSPTATDGSTGYTVNGTLTANFAGTGSTVGINMTIANSVSNSLTVNGTATSGGTAFFSAFFASTGTGCHTTSCNTSINGFFAGTNASRAGLSYTIDTGSSNIQGVAAFARN